MWWLCAMAVASTPALLDPSAARREALAETSTGASDLLRAAEVLLWARDLAGAHAALERIAPRDRDGRHVRVSLDVAVAAQQLERASALATELYDVPGWRSHAARQATIVFQAERRQKLATFGRVLLALALAVLLLGGARELLVPRASTWALAAAAASSVLVVWWVSPVFAQLLAIVDLAMVTLAHAGLASIRRVQPSQRGRVFVGVLVLVGSFGALVAATAAVPWSFLLEAAQGGR